jgi:hypothetical protein
MSTDRSSVWMIVFANVLALGIAWWQHWPMPFLIIPYWIQSVVIGWYSGRRMLALKRFTSGTTSYDDDDEGTKKLIAAGRETPEEFVRRNRTKFFAMHYGLFHFGYLFFMFMWIQTGKLPGHLAIPEISRNDILWLAAISLVFLLTHRASFLRNIERDRSGRPSIETVMFLPYARVLPMHATFVFGLTMGYTHAVLLFGILKTIADVVMHIVEHRVLGAPAAR